MSDFIFPVARDAGFTFDPTTLGVLLLKQNAQSDRGLKAHSTLATLLAAPGNAEANFTNYARKTGLTGDVLNHDTISHRLVILTADQTWSAAGGTADNSLVRLIVFCDQAGTDATRVPLVAYDIAVTTDGSDFTAAFAADGIVDIASVSLRPKPSGGGGGSTPAALTVIVDTGPGYPLGALTSIPIAVGDAGSNGVTGHMTTLPIPTAAGGIVSAGLRHLGVPTFAGELQVLSVGIGVSNMDRSQGLFVTNASALADLTSGGAAGSWTDFAAPAFQVGADLVSDDAGTITSTAGGVFVAEARVQLLWVPA